MRVVDLVKVRVTDQATAGRSASWQRHPQTAGSLPNDMPPFARPDDPPAPRSEEPAKFS